MYGFWLPNDPRGSGSDFIASWELFRYGAATKVDTKRSVAAKPHDVTKRLSAKHTLQYPPVSIDGQQAVAIAGGFREACQQSGYRIHACAILPEHIHLVVGAHQRNIRAIIGHLKSSGTRELKHRGLWLDETRPIWGAHGWNVPLESASAVERAIRYVETNPSKEGKRPQQWSFVTKFDLAEAQSIARSLCVQQPRRIGGAALKSHEASRKRRG